MCWICGGRLEDDHGDPRALTTARLQRAAEAAGTDIAGVVRNLAASDAQRAMKSKPKSVTTNGKDKEMNLQKATNDLVAGILAPYDKKIAAAQKRLRKDPSDTLARVERDSAFKQRTLMKLCIAENARMANPFSHMSKAGPGSFAIITNRRQLEDDVTIFGAR